MKRPVRTPKLELRSALSHVVTLLLVVCVLVGYCPLASAVGKPRKPPAPKIGKIFVVSPKASNVVASGNAITVRYNVNDPDITSVKIKVTNGVDAASGSADLNEARVFLFPGTNTVELFGFAGSELDGNAHTTLQVECNTGCISGAVPAGGMVQSSTMTQPVNAVHGPAQPPAVVTASEKLTGGKSLVLRLPATVNAATVEPMVIVQEQSGISRLVIDVYQNGHRVDSADLSKIDYQDGLGIVTAKLKIAQGVNEIHVFDPRHFGEPGSFTSSSLTCKGDKCVGAEPPANTETEAATAPAKPNKPNADAPAGDEEEAAIKILKPGKTTTVDAPSIDVYLGVANAVKKLKYEVLNGETVLLSETIDLSGKTEEQKKEFPVTVRIVKDSNTISFFNADEPNDTKQRAAINVGCTGDHCASDFTVSKFPSASQNSRAIVGFEQAGGSSAQSQTKPVLDFFFMTPFLFDHKEKCEALDEVKRPKCDVRNAERRLLPRFGFWGDVRIASTPDQIAAAQVFPATLVNQIDKADKAVDLVQSFDFLAGGEVRIKTANGSFLSLIPGIRQKSSLYFAVGGGAISPLNARKDSIQIFNIPDTTDARRAEFVNRYGEPPDGKKYIALTPVDRDRFLRQWYAGVRLKTFYCDDPECRTFKNNFPAIVDFMFGQNEAVTGGSRKRGGTPDPNDPNKLVGQKNAYILRIDGFYPFPVKEMSFLYFYGTAMMKVGGGGAKITTPLFLDNPGTTVQINDAAVFMPATNVLKLQQPDRDYYKLGVGINLTDLFNRNKPRPQ